MAKLLISASVFTTHSFFEHYPPSSPNAHHPKKLPNAFISFSDLVKLNKLIHPRANW